MAKTKGISDGRLMHLWRKAVLIANHHRCFFCGKHGDENLQCHHIVRRKKKLTRYDWKNGIPLCAQCHQVAHTKKGETMIAEKHIYYGYLLDRESVNWKDFLTSSGKTENEVLTEVKKELMDIINEGD